MCAAVECIVSRMAHRAKEEPREPKSYSSAIKSALVELLAGVTMVVVGVMLQVDGADPKHPDAALTVAGGILLALGGVLLSWLAARILADKQNEENKIQARVDAEAAMQAAQSEVDDRLNSLSRALGQAAGQITQAVEKVQSNNVSAATGFELVSQANRMIYGQVNEIAVLRKSKFDPAYLLDTAAKLDELARELSATTHADEGAVDAAGIATVREQLESVRKGLTISADQPVRSISKEDATCPYCDRPVRVALGTTPGDTASATCPHCGEMFNAHRNSAGGAFTRRRGPQGGPVASPQPRWKFECPKCGGVISASDNGKGQREMVCPQCFEGLLVDPGLREVEPTGPYQSAPAQDARRVGSRPRSRCPECESTVNMPLRFQDGYFGYCSLDRVVLTITDEDWRAILDSQTRPEQPNVA